MSLYEYMGFREDPFAVKIAENEQEYLSQIFIKPSYFDSVIESILQGHSRFVIGQRGHGKTAIIQEIEKVLSKNKNFVVKANNFDDVPIAQNEREFIQLFLQLITKELAVRIIKEPKILNRLTKGEREEISVLFRNFYNTLSKSDFEQLSNNIEPFITKRKFAQFINFFSRILNKGKHVIDSYTPVLLQTLIASPDLTVDKIEKSSDLFEKINVIEPTKENVKKSELWNYSTLKSILISTAKSIKKLGYTRVVIILDQIDEYVPLDGKVSKIVEFTKNIYKDNSLINNDEITFVMTLWSKLQDKLSSDGVRFDKIERIDLNWNSQKLKEMLSKRLIYFSLNSEVTAQVLVNNQANLDFIITLANKSPRDLFGLLSQIYREQSELNPNLRSFSQEAINLGVKNFISNYNFIAHGTSEKNADVTQIRFHINCLLKTSHMQFDLQQLVKHTNIPNTNKANDTCKYLMDLNIIAEMDDAEGEGHRIFKIIDPKIEHLIKTGVKSI